MLVLVTGTTAVRFDPFKFARRRLFLRIEFNKCYFAPGMTLLAFHFRVFTLKLESFVLFVFVPEGIFFP